MTKKSIGAHILAGAITGIISGAQAGANAPAGPAGTNTPANMAALGAGFNATGAKMAEMRNAPQARLDAQTLAKQKAMTNNIQELQNQIAVSKLHEDQWDQTEGHYNKIEAVTAPILENIETANKGVEGQPLILGRKLSHEEVMQQSQGHQGEFQVIQDGHTTRTDPATGNPYSVPTYTLVRNTGTVNVDRKALGVLAQYNDDIANLLARSSITSVPMSTTQLINLEKDAHQGMIAEGFINDIRAGIDKSHEGEEGYKPLGKVQGFNTAYRTDKAFHSQIDQLTGVLGSYGTHSTTSALDELMAGKQGGALMPFFGVDRDTLADYVDGKKREVIAADAEAKKAGTPAKAFTEDSALEAAQDNSNPARQQQAKQWLAAKQQYDIKTAAGKKTAETAAENAATPSGNLTGDDYLKTLPAGRQSQLKAYAEGRLLLSNLPRGKEKTALVDALNQAYPDFDQSKGETWGKTRNEYMGSGATAKKVVSYNTALEHMADLYDHSTYEGLYRPGSKDYSDRSVALNYVTNEVGNAIKNGIMTEKEGKEILDSLKGWLPSTAKERTAETARLLNDKIDEYQRKFQEAAPSSHITTPTLISPRAHASYDHVVNGAAMPQAPAGHKVGDTIQQGGHSYTVTSVDANGKVTGAK
jgi:hypothetical protein